MLIALEILGLLLTAGPIFYNLLVSVCGAGYANQARKTLSTIQKVATSSGTTAEKLLNSLANKNAAEQNSVFYNNPILGKNLNQLKRESDKITDFSLKLGKMKDELNNLQIQIGQSDTSTIKGSKEGVEHLYKIEKAAKEKEKEIERLTSDIESYSKTLSAKDGPITVGNADRSEFKDITQNIEGGSK